MASFERRAAAVLRRAGPAAAVGLLVLALGGILANAWWAYRYMAQRLDTALDRRIEMAAREGRRLVTDAAGLSAGPLWTEQEGRDLRRGLAAMRNALRLENLFVFDRDMRSLADARSRVAPGKAYTFVHLSPEAVRRVLAGKTFVDRKLDVESLAFRNAAVPLVIDGEVVGGVYAQASIGFEEDLRRLRQRWQVAGALSVAVTAGLVLGMVLLQTRMNRLRAALDRRARLDLIGLLSAGIAHDIKNPLTGIKAAEEMLGERVGDDRENAELLGIIKDGAARILDIVQNLLGGGAAAAPEAVPLAEFARAVVKPMRIVARDKGVQLSVEIDDAVRVWAPRPALRMALANLLKNAIEAVAPGQGRVSVKCRMFRRFAGLAVSDNGPGIGRAKRRRLFDPLVSTKESGSGLGLAVTRRLVQDMGGSMQLETEPGVGSTFVMQIPLWRGDGKGGSGVSDGRDTDR